MFGKVLNYFKKYKNALPYKSNLRKYDLCYRLLFSKMIFEYYKKNSSSDGIKEELRSLINKINRFIQAVPKDEIYLNTNPQTFYERSFVNIYIINSENADSSGIVLIDRTEEFKMTFVCYPQTDTNLRDNEFIEDYKRGKRVSGLRSSIEEVNEKFDAVFDLIDLQKSWLEQKDELDTLFPLRPRSNSELRRVG